MMEIFSSIFYIIWRKIYSFSFYLVVLVLVPIFGFWLLAVTSKVGCSDVELRTPFTTEEAADFAYFYSEFDLIIRKWMEFGAKFGAKTTIHVQPKDSITKFSDRSIAYFISQVIQIIIHFLKLYIRHISFLWKWFEEDRSECFRERLFNAWQASW